jgi:hypothetical protein
MPDRRKMSRLAIASLLAGALTAPVANAKPIDGGYTSKAYAPSSAQMDMHASTVKKPASANQDLRTEGSIAPSRAAAQASGVKTDLRSENAADPSRAPESPVGMPTWPADPKPIAPVAPQPVAGDGDGGNVEWPIAVLALTGALALGGALVIAGRRFRTQTRPAH